MARQMDAYGETNINPPPTTTNNNNYIVQEV